MGKTMIVGTAAFNAKKTDRNIQTLNNGSHSGVTK
jgi:hypothetical protein